MKHLGITKHNKFHRPHSEIRVLKMIILWNNTKRYIVLFHRFFVIRSVSLKLLFWAITFLKIALFLEFSSRGIARHIRIIDSVKLIYLHSKVGWGVLSICHFLWTMHVVCIVVPVWQKVILERFFRDFTWKFLPITNQVDRFGNHLFVSRTFNYVNSNFQLCVHYFDLIRSVFINLFSINLRKTVFVILGNKRRQTTLNDYLIFLRIIIFDITLLNFLYCVFVGLLWFLWIFN